jgi:hypothetical protein
VPERLPRGCDDSWIIVDAVGFFKHSVKFLEGPEQAGIEHRRRAEFREGHARLASAAPTEV